MILFISKKKYKVIEQAVQDLADNQKKIATSGSEIAKTSVMGFMTMLFCIGLVIGILLRILKRV